MTKPIIYLAGPIGGLAYQEAAEWRTLAENYLKENGFAVRFLRTSAIRIYGGICMKCAEGRPDCLQWHHTKPLRGQPRIGESQIVIEGRIVKANKMLSEYQLLCANCHSILHARLARKGARP